MHTDKYRGNDENCERQKETEAKCENSLKKKKEVMVEVFLFKGCCMFSATSAPLANQQIPLISHSGLEHFQNIHPFLSARVEGCSDGWLYSLSLV